MEGVLRKPRRQATVEQAIRTSLVRQTDKEQYKRCLVHDRCTTREPVIKGHQIPQSYMRRLPGGNNMAIFGKRRFGWPESKLPLSEGIGFATAGYFTCKSHDDWFQDVDRLSDIPALPDKRTLHLMCYRSILYNRWWMHLWAQASARIRDWYGAISQYQINERLLIDDRKMLRSQKAIEQCLESDDSDPQTWTLRIFGISAAWYNKPFLTFLGVIALARHHLWLTSEGFSRSLVEPSTLCNQAA